MASRQRKTGSSIATYVPTIFGIVTALAVIAVLAFLVLPGRGGANNNGELAEGTAIMAPDLALLDITETPTPARTPKVRRIDDPLVIEPTWTATPVLPTDTPLASATTVDLPGFENTPRTLRTDTPLPFETNTPIVFTNPPTEYPTFIPQPTLPAPTATRPPVVPTPSIAPVDPTVVPPTNTAVPGEPTIAAPSATPPPRPTRTLPPVTVTPTLQSTLTETPTPTHTVTATETATELTPTGVITGTAVTTGTPSPTGSVTVSVTITTTPGNPLTPSPTETGTIETPGGSPPP